MTDKLYFDATTECRLNEQPKTFMRTKLLKRLSVAICFCLLLSATFPVAAQISVGPGGSTLQTFDAPIPLATSWSTRSIGSASGDYSNTNTPTTIPALDAAVNGSTNGASGITAAVNSDGGNPPVAASAATWSSSGFYLQTRPTGNGATLLMATLTNVSGAAITNMTVTYNLTTNNIAPANEELPGHRVYYSLSGAAGSWIVLGNFGNPVAQSIPINLVGTPWSINTKMYLLFADDNAVVNNDGSYQIDNFTVTLPVTGNQPCTVPAGFATQPASQALNSGATISLSVAASGSTPIVYQWYRNGSPLANATNAFYSKTNAAPSDSGIYSVVINNCFDSPVTSLNAVVSVADASFVLMGLTNYFWKYLNESTNIDLGTAWQGTNYDDSSWLSGRGIFGVETDAAGIPALINTPLILNHAGGANIITHRLRTTFKFTNDPALVSLTFSNYIDDGAVVYLNSNELFRVNMGGGNVIFTTGAAATGPTPEGTFFVTNFPGTAFRNGTNTLAVEVHQSGTASSDVDFGMAVFVNFPAPSLLIITNQPQSIIVEESHQATFTLGLQGQPAYYQWYKNGAVIPNATGNPFIIPSISVGDVGNYFVVASNSINSVTSSIVSLSTFTDTNGPTLVAADGTATDTSVLVSFSELISLTNATNVLNYKITNTVNNTSLTISSASLQNGTNVLLQTSARTTGHNYILVVNNIRDTSPLANLIATNSSIPVSSTLSIVALTGAWRAYDPYPDFPIEDPADLGTAWKETNYVEGSASTNSSFGGFNHDVWGDGNGIFWLAQDPSSIPGPTGTQLQQSSAVISYFRAPFNAKLSLGGLKLFLTHIFDDGAVVYLNGTEIYRFNMPSGTVNYQTRALTAVNPVTRVGPIAIPTDALRSGSNVLAVELHQFVPVSTNKAMAVQLDASVLSYVTGKVVITRGPLDLTLTEGQSATFSVVQVGGATFQWQANSVNIPGGTDPVYVTNATFALNGTQYRVVVTGAGGSVTSSVATLHVIADTNAPTLVSAFASTNAITVSFSEPVTTASAQTIGNYTVTNAAGQSFTVTGATLSNGTNVTLAFASLNAGTYFLVVNNVRDTSTAANLIAPNSSVKVGFQAQIITFDTFWKYEQSNTDLGTNWSTRTYDDNAWSSGQSMLGGKVGTVPATLPMPIRTTLDVRDSGGVNDIPTHYFRYHFNSFSSGAGSISFRTVIDDGCVIYLNGVEIFRKNLPGGTIVFSTLAPGAAPADGNDAPFIDTTVSVPVANLLAGDNVIAVEVHQNSLTSSDVYWAAELSVLASSGAIQPGNAVQIVTQPRSRTNAVGSAASLYVIASGDPTLQYQWRTNGVNIPNQTNSTIILNPIQLTNAGNYTVTVSNLFSGAISSVATVTVTNPPGTNCTYITAARPTLTNRLAGTNFVLSWPSAPVQTNSCGATAVFTLQGALYLSNSPSAIVWSNLSTLSPYTNGIPTNRVPNAFGTRFYRLVLLP